jgi:hypothetical protein
MREEKVKLRFLTQVFNMSLSLKYILTTAFHCTLWSQKYQWQQNVNFKANPGTGYKDIIYYILKLKKECFGNWHLSCMYTMVLHIQSY